MKRLFVLFALALAFGLNACEQHKAKDLPEEFQKDGKHSQNSEVGAVLADAGQPAPR
jgi:protein involved in sex pheromone biosynthesis